MPVTFQWKEGNQVELLINGSEYFPAVFDSIRAARREILIETFIIFDDEVGQELKAVLLEAAAREVRIEVTVDGYGTADLSSDYIAELTEAGVHMHIYDPQPRRLGVRTNLFRRLHRKIVVVDGELAYISGINFGWDHLPERYTMGKQDYGVRVRGPIVTDIRHAALNRQISEHLAELVEHSCRLITPEVAEKGRWWRAPLMFASFHFLRHFPLSAGWSPGHTPRLKSLTPESQALD